MRVTIIDSGLGGVIFSELVVQEVKYFDPILLIDYEGFPYGDKGLDWLKDRIMNLVDNSKTNIVIIACNTLSSVIYEYDLIFKKKVVDVITPTISFFMTTNYKKIVILATKNTIKIDVYKRLLDDVFYIDASKLIFELQNSFDYSDSLDEIISLIPNDCDYLLLGCTHLIYIKEKFRKKLNMNVVSQDEIFVSLFKNDFINY